LVRRGAAQQAAYDRARYENMIDLHDHWEDKAVGLSEIRRILTQDGRLVVVKDGGLPGGRKAQEAFLGELARAGFAVSQEQKISEGDVSFTMWICSYSP
jgi:hypothetical protein